MTVEEALQDIQDLRTLAGGLTRKPNSLYTLLKGYYRVREKWCGCVSTSLRDEILKREAKRIHGRTKQTQFRFLIELTYDCDTQLRSRYANALEYARLQNCSVREVVVFFKRNGIEKCANKYVAYRKRSLRSKRIS